MELRTQKFTTALYSYCNKGAQKIGSASVITLSFIGLCDFSHILSNTSTIIDGISFNKVVAQMFGRRTVNQSTNNHIVEPLAFLQISWDDFEYTKIENPVNWMLSIDGTNLKQQKTNSKR